MFNCINLPLDTKTSGGKQFRSQAPVVEHILPLLNRCLIATKHHEFKGCLQTKHQFIMQSQKLRFFFFYMYPL